MLIFSFLTERRLGDFKPVRDIGEGASVVVYFRSGGTVRREKGDIVRVYASSKQPSNQVVYFRTTSPLRLMSIGGGTLARPINIR